MKYRSMFWSTVTDNPDFKVKNARGYGYDGFGWALENQRPIPFWAARGKLGLFIPEGIDDGETM